MRCKHYIGFLQSPILINSFGLFCYIKISYLKVIKRRTILKKVIRTIPLLILFFSLILVQSGCDKTEDTITPVIDESVEKETVTSKDMAALTNLLTSANSILWRYINTGPREQAVLMLHMIPVLVHCR